MAVVRVPRKGVTQAELTTVLSRRLGGGYEVESNGDGLVVVRRSSLSTAVVRIRDVPGATVFRVRGGGLPVYRMGTARRVADAIRRSPEFRSVLSGASSPPVDGSVPAGLCSYHSFVHAESNIALHPHQSRPELY